MVLVRYQVRFPFFLFIYLFGSQWFGSLPPAIDLLESLFVVYRYEL